MAHTVEETPVAWHPSIVEVCNIPEPVDEDDTSDGTGIIFNVTNNFYQGVDSQPIRHIFDFPFKILRWKALVTVLPNDPVQISILHIKFSEFFFPGGSIFTSLVGLNFPTIPAVELSASSVDLSAFTKTVFDDDDTVLSFGIASHDDFNPLNPGTVTFSLKCERL